MERTAASTAIHQVSQRSSQRATKHMEPPAISPRTSEMERTAASMASGEPDTAMRPLGCTGGGSGGGGEGGRKGAANRPLGFTATKPRRVRKEEDDFPP